MLEIADLFSAKASGRNTYSKQKYRKPMAIYQIHDKQQRKLKPSQRGPKK